jgi:Fur family zinc uptake transcriptional regulator
MEQGLAHRLASHNAYVACPHGHGPADLVAFLICEDCGGVDELSSQPLSEALTGLLARERFQPQRRCWRFPAVAAIAGRLLPHDRAPARPRRIPVTNPL